MKIRSSLVLASIVIGLGTTSMAMAHQRDETRAQLREASWHFDQADKGDKKGFNDGALPPKQAKSESKAWQREHKREAKANQKQAKIRQKEARAYRRPSHEAVVHKQPKSPQNLDKTLAKQRMDAGKSANKQHKKEVQH
ncbi:MAG: hypothetical protein ACM3JB_01560 [Acidobacteriaceae bacterium]